MPKVLTRSSNPLYRSLFPSWEDARPLQWFLMENLLEARRESAFPTNAAGPDEDVNVYLAHLLGGLLAAPEGPQSTRLADPLLLPPTATAARLRAESYRRHGDQRLLALGLFGRGDLLRRRRTPWGWDEDAAAARDRGLGRTCYRCAADLLAGRPGQDGLRAVLEKLGARFDDYVGILSGLATGRLGLGARLSPTALERLLAPEPVAADRPPVTATPRPGPAMDHLLDLLLEHRRQPSAETARRLTAGARAQGLDPEPLLAQAAAAGAVSAPNRS